MKNLLIVEDNANILQALEQAVEKLGSNICVYTAKSYEEACLALFQRRFDVFVLDIILTTKVPGDTSGIKLAEQIRKYDRYLFTPIIFITALADPEMYAYRQLHSYGYLEKPFSMQEAVRLIEQALKYNTPEDGERQILFRKDGILFAVMLNEIMYVEVRNHNLVIHCVNEELEIPYITVKHFLKETGDGGFVQCSRNTVVNRKYVKSIDTVNRYIQLTNLAVVEIGPTFNKKIGQDFLHV